MFGEWGPTTVRTVDLGYEQLLMLDGRPGTRVKVLYGGVWLTEEGSPQDVFAGSGEEVAVRSRGLSVIEGLGLARVQVIEPVRRSWRQALTAGARALTPVWSARGVRAIALAAAIAIGIALPELVVDGMQSMLLTQDAAVAVAEQQAPVL
jgi:hypothetical protein